MFVLMWDAADAEGLAEYVLRRASADADRPQSPRRIAHALGIAVQTAPGGHWGPAGLWPVKDVPTIFLSSRVPTARRPFLIAHEIAEWAAQQLGIVDADIERFCDAAAAAIMAPRPAMRALLRRVGDDYAAIARALVSTETCAALRVGEVTGRHLAVVAPTAVRVRGLGEWVWGSEEALRRLARAAELPENIDRVALGDEPRRWVLRAA